MKTIITLLLGFILFVCISQDIDDSSPSTPQHNELVSSNDEHKGICGFATSDEKNKALNSK